MVDVALVDDNLRVAALYELLHQFVDGAVVDVNGVHLSTRHHTVAHLAVGEVEGVLEYLHLLVNLLVAMCILDARLHEIVEVYLREAFVVGFRLHAYAHNAQQALRHKRREAAYRPQEDVEKIGWHGEYGQQAVGVVLEQNLGQELSCEKNDECGEQRVGCHLHAVVERAEDSAVKEACHKDTIHHKHDIVTHKHRAHKAIGMIVEFGNDFLRNAISFAIHLSEHSVARHERYLHS